MKREALKDENAKDGRRKNTTRKFIISAFFIVKATLTNSDPSA